MVLYNDFCPPTTMEMMTVRMIDDDSDNKGNADDNENISNNHNGNNNKAPTMRPGQQEHDNKTTMRYNNQLNGSPWRLM